MIVADTLNERVESLIILSLIHSIVHELFHINEKSNPLLKSAGGSSPLLNVSAEVFTLVSLMTHCNCCQGPCPPISDALQTALSTTSKESEGFNKTFSRRFNASGAGFPHC